MRLSVQYAFLHVAPGGTLLVPSNNDGSFADVISCRALLVFDDGATFHAIFLGSLLLSHENTRQSHMSQPQLGMLPFTCHAILWAGLQSACDQMTTATGTSTCHRKVTSEPSFNSEDRDVASCDTKPSNGLSSRPAQWFGTPGCRATVHQEDEGQSND